MSDIQFMCVNTT